jgi:hypothetical protein
MPREAEFVICEQPIECRRPSACLRLPACRLASALQANSSPWSWLLAPALSAKICTHGDHGPHPCAPALAPIRRPFEQQPEQDGQPYRPTSTLPWRGTSGPTPVRTDRSIHQPEAAYGLLTQCSYHLSRQIQRPAMVRPQTRRGESSMVRRHSQRGRRSLPRGILLLTVARLGGD